MVFDGQDLGTLSPAALKQARAGFQMVFQDPYGSLDPRRTVLQTVAEPLRVLHGAGKAEQLAKGAEALEAVGLRAAQKARNGCFPNSKPMPMAAGRSACRAC